jgi:hypothetical protein
VKPAAFRAKNGDVRTVITKRNRNRPAQPDSDEDDGETPVRRKPSGRIKCSDLQTTAIVPQKIRRYKSACGTDSSRGEIDIVRKKRRRRLSGGVSY